MKKALRLAGAMALTIAAMSLAACGAFSRAYITRGMQLRNPLARARMGAGVTIDRGRLGARPGDAVLEVRIPPAQESVPFQTDDLDGDGQWDVLFFQADMPARGAVPVRVVVGRPTGVAMGFEKRVAARIDGNPKPHKDYPRGFQQPAWESEVFGYRTYGPTQIDYYGKVKPELTLGFFLDQPKHNHHQFWPGKGMDCLFVGQTMGGHAIFVREPDGKVERPWTTNGYYLKGPIPNDATYRFDVLADGPLRAIVRARISDWESSMSKTEKYACEILYEIRAGRRETLVDVRFTGHPQEARRFQFGAGMGTLKEDVAVRHTVHYLTAVAKDYEITGKKVDACARAILTPENSWTTRIDIPNDPSIADSRPGNGPNYAILFEPAITHARYAIAGAWSLDGGVRSVDQWEAYLEKTVEELQNPVTVR